jgi:hypothetical protein
MQTGKEKDLCNHTATCVTHSISNHPNKNPKTNPAITTNAAHPPTGKPNPSPAYAQYLREHPKYPKNPIKTIAIHRNSADLATKPSGGGPIAGPQVPAGDRGAATPRRSDRSADNAQDTDVMARGRRTERRISPRGGRIGNPRLR